MNNHYQNLNNVEKQLLRHLLQAELLVFNNNDNNIFSIYFQDNYNTIAVSMEEYNSDKTDHVCSIVLLRFFNRDFHFLKNKSNINKGNGYFEYTKIPTKITIPNCHEIEDISVNNTLEIISIIYKDKNENRFIKLFKFQLPCFLGNCVILNSSLDLDNRFNFNHVKYYIKIISNK